MRDKDKRKEYAGNYYKEHREQINLSNKKYRDEHQGLLKEYRKKRREKMQRYMQELRWGIKIKLISFLGGFCRMCNCSDPRVLQINHKNGRGTKETRNSPGYTGESFYSKILKGERAIDDLELLCANCNILYEYEQGRRFGYVKTI